MIVVVVLAAGVLLAGRFGGEFSGDFDEGDLPKIIQADWIDLDRIGSISRFRSGAGHDFSGNGETCRSMKHYFNPARTEEEQEIINKNNGFPPPFSLENAISVYSPVDGEIIDVADDGYLGEQVYIRSARYPDFTVRLFHIFLPDGYGKGVKVKAGEKIGNVGGTQNTDIAVSVGNPRGRKFVSYFRVMPDEIFAKYRAAGVKSRDQLVITKEYRDAHPLECRGERFAENYDSAPGNSVFINGYGPLRRGGN